MSEQKKIKRFEAVQGLMNLKDPLRVVVKNRPQRIHKSKIKLRVSAEQAKWAVCNGHYMALQSWISSGEQA